MRLADVHQILHFTTYERGVVALCIDSYSHDMTLEVLVSRVWNAIRHIFGTSDWQIAKNVLERRIAPMIASYAIDRVDPAPATTALSEFVLRYLVTRATIEQREHQFLIPQRTWNEENFSDLEAEVVFARSMLGNGTNLPAISRDHLVELLQRERRAFQRKMEAFERNLDENPMVQACERLNQQFASLIGNGPRIGGRPKQEMQDPNAQPESPAELAEWLIVKSKVVLTKCAQVEDANFLRTRRTEELLKAALIQRIFYRKFDAPIAHLRNNPLYGGVFG